MSSQIYSYSDLFQYQKDAVKFLSLRDKSILRLDTGLGKTAVCINYAKKMNSIRNILVIAPAFLVGNWEREINMWGGYAQHNINSQGLLVGKINKYWNVLSYNKSSRNIEELNKQNYDLIICDEAHYLKSWEAKRTQNIILKLLTKTRRVILSTATPYVRSALDLHPLYSVCQPGKWGKASSFAEKYCKKKPNNFKKWKKFDYYSIKEEMAGELKEKSKEFTYSLSKKNAGIDLPSKLTTNLYIDVNSKYHLKNLENIEEYYDIEKGKMVGGLTRILSKEAGKLGLAKVDKALEWIENVDKEQTLVVFCKHKEVANKLWNNIEGSVVMTGDTPMSERDKIVARFQNGEIRVLVCTIGSSGVGITLTKANLCLFVELPWSYTELKQCEDRLHRIGQNECVNVYRMITEKTIDDLIVNVLNDKELGEDLSIGGF